MDIVLPSVTNNIFCDAVKRADGVPITAGTVNIYLIADGGANDTKWWRDSDTTWQAAETIAKAATLSADGHWYANLKAAAFADGQKYRAYARESGDLHVPVAKPVYCAYWGTLTAAYDAAKTAATAASITTLRGADADTLKTLSDEIALIASSVGAGATACTLTVTDDEDVAIADADVWLTSDAAGTAVVAGTLQTDSNGEAEFMLDSGSTYYIWKQKDGVNFTNPESWTV